MRSLIAMKDNSMKHTAKILTGLCCVLMLAFTLAACGGGKDGEGSGDTTTPVVTTPTTVDMSTMGIDTKTIPHATWIATAPHSTAVCNDCHSVDSNAICAQSGCHPFSKYTSLATNFNHVTNKTGEQCNKCHSLTPEPTATDAVRIAGWRKNLKLTDTTKWHIALKGVCTDCHDPVKHDPLTTLSIFPTSHKNDATRQKACEKCHYYKVNTAGTGGKWGGGHTVVTSGCNASGCHTQHYSGYDCAWCHSGAITNSYTSWKNTWTHRKENSQGCAACHGAGGFGD